VVIEGAAGAGKTTTLAAARTAIEQFGGRLRVVTPTLKAAARGGPAGRRRRLIGGMAGLPARLPLGRERHVDPTSGR
jgi:hypothetical protein